MKDKKRWETSVTRCSLVDLVTLWQIGKQARPDKAIYGRAMILVSEIKAVGLSAMEDPMIENEYHAVIVGWPSDDNSNDQKSRHKALAIELAKRAKPLDLNNNLVP